MLKTILIIVAAVIGCLLVVIALQPSEYRVVRTASINAAPATVHQLVNDFHRWDGWSPWAKLDPAMKATYSGAPSGPGAMYFWTGNDTVGEGRMTILESRAAERVVIKLEFLKPFESNSVATFNLTPEGSGSKVEWVMTGESAFMEKGAMLFMGGMDKVIGPDFEKGLKQLKVLAEAPVAASR